MLQINSWRHELIKGLRLNFGHIEMILLNYCETHDLDGWMAKAFMDNRNYNFEDASYEFVILQKCIGKLDEIKKEKL